MIEFDGPDYTTVQDMMNYDEIYKKDEKNFEFILLLVEICANSRKKIVQPMDFINAFCKGKWRDKHTHSMLGGMCLNYYYNI